MEDSKRKKKQMKNVPEINRMEAKESMKDFLTEVCSEKLINFIEDTNTDAESNLRDAVKKIGYFMTSCRKVGR